MTNPLCLNCGRELTPAAVFCPYCGVELAPKEEITGAAAVEVLALDTLRSKLSADEYGELAERLISAIARAAAALGGKLERENDHLFSATFGGEPGAVTAARFVFKVFETVRDLSAPVSAAFQVEIAARGGVEAAEKKETFLPAASHPLAPAKKLRNRAGRWEVFAGETAKSSLANEYEIRPVGFYQTRGGERPLKIYKIGKRQRRDAVVAVPPSPPPPLATFLPLPDCGGFLEAATQGQGPVLIIHGPAGTGKTSFLKKIAEISESSGLQVIPHRFYRRRRYLPYGVLPPLWNAWNKERERSDEKAAQDAVTVLGKEYADFASLCEVALGTPTSITALAGEIPPVLRRRKIIEIATALVQRLAAARPVVIALDDVEYADTSSREIIARLAGLPYVALAATVEDAAAAKWVHPTVRELPTKPLTPFDVAALVADSHLVDLVTRLTQGHLGTVIQLATFLSRGNSLPPDVEVEVGNVLPALIKSSCEDWEPGGRLALAAAAYLEVGLPRRIWNAAFAGALNPEDLAVPSWLDAAIALGFVEPAWPAGDDAFQVPPYLAPAVLAALAPTPQEAQNVAVSAAVFWEKTYPSDEGFRATLEVDADNVVAAADLTLNSARRARWLGAAEDAVAQIAALEQELDIESPHRQRRLPPRLLAELRVAKAACLLDTGGAATALANLASTAIRPGDYLAAHVAYLKGLGMIRRGFTEEAQEPLMEAMRAAVKRNDENLLKDAAALIAEAACEQLDHLSAPKWLQDALDEGALFPCLYSCQAITLHLAGKAGAAYEAAEKVLARYAHDPNSYENTLAAARTVPVLGARGQIKRAIQLSERSLELLRAAGDYENLGRAAYEYAALLTEVINVDEAAAAWKETLTLLQQTDPSHLYPRALLGLARQSILANDVQAAKTNAALAFEELQPDTPEALAYQAYFDYHVGEDYHGALVHAARAREAFHRRGNLAQSYYVSLLASEASAALGDSASGRKELEREGIADYARESPTFHCRYLKAVGAVFQADGAGERAAKYYRAAASLARELGVWQVVVESWLRLSELEQDAGRKRQYLGRASRLISNYGAALLLRLLSKHIGQTL